MPRKQASASIALGMVKIPFGIAKAASTDVPDVKSLCECGGTCSYLSNDEGHKVECTDCGETYSWWNSVPKQGFELGDEMIELDGDEVEKARSESPVETGQVEKVTPVKSVLLRYAIEGNYYLLPEDEFREQYGVLVGVLNDESWALLTYLQFRNRTRRYAIVSEGGVLMALQLQDKKSIPDLEYGTDEDKEKQAKTMLEGMVEDDPSLEDVEGQGLKDLVREKVEPQVKPADDDGMKGEITKEV